MVFRKFVQVLAELLRSCNSCYVYRLDVTCVFSLIIVVHDLCNIYELHVNHACEFMEVFSYCVYALY